VDSLAAQLGGAGDAAGFTQALALAHSEWARSGDSPTPEQALQNAASEWSRYQDAWTAYLNLVTARLASQVQVFVTGTTAPPAGLTGIPWTEPALQLAAVSSVLTTLRPPPAGPPVTWASYMDARWQFARARLAVLSAAHAQIDTFLKSDAGQAGVWADDFTSFTTSLDQVQQPAGADPSPAALAPFEAQLDLVWRDYVVFLTPPVAPAMAPPSSVLESLVPADLSSRFMAAGAALPRLFVAPVQAAGLNVGKFSLAAADIGDVSGLPTRSVSGSLQLIQENDLLVGLVFIVIAGLSGLTALWLTNASWGSFGDWTAAFMWAFGVSATTGTTFNALAANFGQASGG